MKPNNRISTTVAGQPQPRLMATLRRVALGGMIVLVLLPLVPLLINSFADQWFYPDLLPGRLNLRAWRYIGEPGSMILRATATSLLIAIIVTAIAVLLGVPAGRALAGMHRRQRRYWEFAFLVPLMIPSLAIALGLHVRLIQWGLADSIAGVIVAHLLPSLPYMVLVMTATFTQSNLYMEGQARTLGAGPVRAFLVVGLPTVLPGVITGGLFVFLISWSQYALTLLVGGGRVLTLPLLLFAFASAGDPAQTAALSLIFLLPALVVLLLSARYVTGRSVSLGGIIR